MTASSPLANRGTAPAARDRVRSPARATRHHWLVGGLSLVLAAVVGLCAAGTGYVYRDELAAGGAPPSVEIPSDGKGLAQLEARLERRQRQLNAALEKKRPRGTYIVIDQTQNRIFLRRDEDVVLEAKCSAGSGMVLQETGGRGRRWVFDTPRGEFRVLNKVENPMWKKPDWAFIEEGKPIPTNPEERFEAGSLGEYALYFGNGYMIHGTLYERYLERSVSHGCIRVGRDDLREVWRAAPIGTPIYIH